MCFMSSLLWLRCMIYHMKTCFVKAQLTSCCEAPDDCIAVVSWLPWEQNIIFRKTESRELCSPCLKKHAFTVEIEGCLRSCFHGIKDPILKQCFEMQYIDTL